MYYGAFLGDKKREEFDYLQTLKDQQLDIRIGISRGIYKLVFPKTGKCCYAILIEGNVLQYLYMKRHMKKVGKSPAFFSEFDW